MENQLGNKKHQGRSGGWTAGATKRRRRRRKKKWYHTIEEQNGQGATAETYTNNTNSQHASTTMCIYLLGHLTLITAL